MSSKHRRDSSQTQEEGNKEEVKRDETKKKKVKIEEISKEKGCFDGCPQRYHESDYPTPLFLKNSAPTTSHDKWIKMSQKMTAGIVNTVITHLALLCSGKKNWKGLWR